MNNKSGWEPAGSVVSPRLATAEMLFELGMMYCIGQTVEKDFITAHKWLNLAALKGSEEAKSYRCELSREMTPSEVAEAQRQARAWITMH